MKHIQFTLVLSLVLSLLQPAYARTTYDPSEFDFSESDIQEHENTKKEEPKAPKAAKLQIETPVQDLDLSSVEEGGYSWMEITGGVLLTTGLVLSTFFYFKPHFKERLKLGLQKFVARNLGLAGARYRGPHYRPNDYVVSTKNLASLWVASRQHKRFQELGRASVARQAMSEEDRSALFQEHFQLFMKNELKSKFLTSLQNGQKSIVDKTGKNLGAALRKILLAKPGKLADEPQTQLVLSIVPELLKIQLLRKKAALAYFTNRNIPMRERLFEGDTRFDDNHEVLRELMSYRLIEIYRDILIYETLLDQPWELDSPLAVFGAYDFLVVRSLGLAATLSEEGTVASDDAYHVERGLAAENRRDFRGVASIALILHGITLRFLQENMHYTEERIHDLNLDFSTILANLERYILEDDESFSDVLEELEAEILEQEESQEKQSSRASSRPQARPELDLTSGEMRIPVAIQGDQSRSKPKKGKDKDHTYDESCEHQSGRANEKEKDKDDNTESKVPRVLTSEERRKVLARIKNDSVYWDLFNTAHLKITHHDVVNLAKRIAAEMKSQGIDPTDFLSSVEKHVHPAHKSSDTGAKMPRKFVKILRMRFVASGICLQDWIPQSREDFRAQTIYFRWLEQQAGSRFRSGMK